MKKEELLIVYSYARAIWSTFKTPEDEMDAKLHDAVWFDLLLPYSADIVVLALREYAKTSDFCNIAKVAEICKKLTSMKKGTYIDEEAIYDEIRKAIACCNKDETFENLSDFAKEIVGGAWQLYKWGSCTTDQVEGVIMSRIKRRIQNKKEAVYNNELLLELEAGEYISKNLLGLSEE